jgi:hypothetical protein
VLRARDDVPRLRVLLRAGFFAAPVAALFARAAGALRAVLARVDRVAEDFARAEVAFFAVLRLAVDRFALVFRAPLPRDADALELAPELSSADHLPDITRCAASATASAINVPSLVALAMTLLAA